MHDAISVWCDFLCEKSTVSCWFGHDHKPDQVQIWHGDLPLRGISMIVSVVWCMHTWKLYARFPSTTHNLDNLAIQKKQSDRSHLHCLRCVQRWRQRPWRCGWKAQCGSMSRGLRPVDFVHHGAVLGWVARVEGWLDVGIGWVSYTLIWQVDVWAWCESSCESSGYPTVITTTCITPNSLSKHFILYKKRNMCTASRCMYIPL